VSPSEAGIDEARGVPGARATAGDAALPVAHHPDGELEPVLGHGCQGPVDEDRDAENERADAPNDAPPANRTGA
jgi:hypothetical protein